MKNKEVIEDLKNTYSIFQTYNLIQTYIPVYVNRVEFLNSEYYKV